MYDLITVKIAIRDLFPQLRKVDFKVWQDSSQDSESFCLQCYVGNEFYGNEYIVNLKDKTLENRK